MVRRSPRTLIWFYGPVEDFAMVWLGPRRRSCDLPEILEFSGLGYLLGTVDLEAEGPCFDKK